MQISLYAHGPCGTEEVGRFHGLDKDNAQEHFVDICRSLDLHVISDGNSLEVHNMAHDSESFENRLHVLIRELAYVENFKGLPPIKYSLSETDYTPTSKYGYLKDIFDGTSHYKVKE